MRNVLITFLAAALLVACGDGLLEFSPGDSAEEADPGSAVIDPIEQGDGDAESAESVGIITTQTHDGILYIRDFEGGEVGVDSQQPFESVEFHVETTHDFDLRVLDSSGEAVLDWTDGATLGEDLGHAREGFFILGAPGQRVELRSSAPVSFARFAVGEEHESPFAHETDGDIPEDAVVTYRSRPGRWIPPAKVLSVANTQYVSYSTPPSRCSGTFLPGTREVAEYLKRTFAGAVAYGGYACRANTASPGQLSVHASGRAIDLFVPLHNGAADNDLGDPIANYLIANAERLGIEYLIWDRTSWGGYRAAPKHRAYTGPHPHHDHLHIELSPTSARRTGRNFPGSCRASREVCDGKDNDCDGKKDEGEVCEERWINRHAVTYAPPSTTDIDGDGDADVCGRGGRGFWCHRSTGTDFRERATATAPISDSYGWKNPMYNSTLRMGDIDGDGTAEMCARAAARVYCYKLQSGSWKRIDGPRLSNDNGWNKIKHYSTIRLADVTGDGKDDICARGGAGLMCWPSKGTSFGRRIDGPAWSNEKGFGSAKYYGTLRNGDINGDGKQDFCIRASRGIRCVLSTGNGFSRQFAGPEWSNDKGWGKLLYWSSIRMGDVNGDGKDDICARGSAGVRCNFSKGNAFGRTRIAAEWRDDRGWKDVSNHATLRLADIDGDGATDICARANRRVHCRKWTGSGFTGVAGPAWSDDNGWANASNYNTLRFGDFDGDGKADACARAHAGWICRRSTGRAFSSTNVHLDEYKTASGWDKVHYYSTIMFGG